MNPEFFGDSYDHTKKFLLDLAPPSACRIALPMLPKNSDPNFLLKYQKFLDVNILPCAIEAPNNKERQSWIGKIQEEYCKYSEHSLNWLFADPCTGISYGNARTSSTHLSVEEIITLTKIEGVSVLICYDQAFSRCTEEKRRAVAEEKLQAIRNKGISALYFASHASFLIASTKKSAIIALREKLSGYGFPSTRIIE